MITAEARAGIETQAEMYAERHPDATAKEIGEAYEAVWFESEHLSDDDVVEAGALVVAAVERLRGDVVDPEFDQPFC